LPRTLIACCLALSLGLALAPARALAEDGRLPLWEVGAGVGALTLPDYPGSDQTDNYVVPVPYLVYRGEIFKADKDGMRARFLDNPRWELVMSLGGTPPVRSRDSDTRRGMPDLSAAIELGPELRVHLLRDAEDEKSRTWEVNFHLPVRHSVTKYEGRFHHVGNIAYPHLNAKRKFHVMGELWEVDADLGAYFNSHNYHRYFYQVLPQYETPQRRAYDPGGGYGGWEGSFYTTKDFGRWHLAGFVTYGSIGGASFEDGPLIRRDFTLSAGLALTYVFWVSESTVPAP